jgi:fatty acid CoA ligase FadD32
MALGGHSLDPGSLSEPLIELVARHAAELPSEPAYTYVDYSINPAGARRTLTWSQTHRRAKAMAATLREVIEPGDRVALLMPQGIEYITALLGALYARVIAVPLFSPDLPGHADRLVRAYADADAACVLTTNSALPHVERFLDGQSVPRPKEIILADDLDLSLGAGWQAEEISPDDVAYLQYTSGSTRAPAGVQITHRNITANALQTWAGYPDRGKPRESCMVSWLPLFHDMGLISVFALPIVHGNQSVFFDPVAFVMHPVRWLRLLSEYDDVVTAGPNFAYEYCVDRIPEADRAELDLSGVTVCLNGAEPIRPSTLSAFAEAFAATGLNPGAPTPGFGLAEATVFVSAKTSHDPPKVTAFDREALAAGTAIPVGDDAERASHLVSCGNPVGQLVAIVDPETRLEQPDGQVGEIWVNGPNVAPGYWRNPEKTAETFGATLEGVGGLPSGGWLRTGDFGIIHDRELYVTGRIKDLIIVDGRNHYPQDIEATTQEAHPGIRRDHVAAFAITGEPGEAGEQVVVVAERGRGAIVKDATEVAQVVRAAVSSGHELHVHDFVLVKSGGVPRTSSGKIARNACRQRYLAGELPVVGGKSTTN